MMDKKPSRLAACARTAFAFAFAVSSGMSTLGAAPAPGMRLRFDEQAPGYFFDSVGPGVVTNDNNDTSTIYTYATTGGYNRPEDYYIGATPSEYMPRYTTPFQGMRIYDPMKGRGWMNRSAMRFTTGKKDGVANGESYYGGCVVWKPSSTSSTYSTRDAITIECFVCTTGGVFDIFAPIFGKRNRSSETGGADFAHESWALYMTANGKLEVRFSTINSSGAVTTHNPSQDNGEINGEYGRGVAINDGNWHHVALTYDKADGLCRVYVDYVQQFTTEDTNKNPIYYSKSTSDLIETGIYIGGYPYVNKSDNRGRKFDGCIDEFRIYNDIALVPNQFLRIEPEDRDEIFRLRLDPHGYYGNDLTPITNAYYSANYYKRNYTYAFNPTIFDTVFVDCTAGTASTASLDSGESCAPTVKGSVLGTSSCNYGSLSLVTNECGLSGYMLVKSLTTWMSRTAFDTSDDYVETETNLDYTVELFFKTRNTETATGTRTIYQLGTWPVAGAVVNRDNTGRVCFTWNDGYYMDGEDKKANWRGTYSTETNANDGNWHHIATVCDTARKQMRFYYDGKLTAVSNNVNNTIQTGSSLFVGANWEGTNSFNGWIDDIRVTLRALSPSEFLATNSIVADATMSGTMMITDFEQEKWEDGKNQGYMTAPYMELTRPVSRLNHGESDKWPQMTGCGRFYSTDGESYIRGAKCSKLEDAILAWKACPLYEQDEFTVEFFEKITGLESEASPIRYADADGINTNGVWGLYRDPTNANRLRLRINLMKDGVPSEDDSDAYNTAYWDISPSIADGQWHHYAFTLATKDGTNTVVELFRDYVSLGSKEIDGRIDYTSKASGRLTVGGGTTYPPDDLKRFYGSVDMLRFSKGVLTPDKFIKYKSAGLIMVSK